MTANHTNVYDDNAATDIAVGLDGTVNYEIIFRANESNTLGGSEPGKPLWLCLDTGTEAEWQRPSTFELDGVELAEGRSGMKENDLDGTLVQASEFCYRASAPISDGLHTLFLTVKASSGNNPDTTADDLRLCVLGEGTFESSRRANTILQGIYNDAGTKALVVYDANRNPCLDFNIQ